MKVEFVLYSDMLTHWILHSSYIEPLQISNFSLGLLQSRSFFPHKMWERHSEFEQLLAKMWKGNIYRGVGHPCGHLTPIHFDRDSLVIFIPVCAFPRQFNDKIHLRMALHDNTTPDDTNRVPGWYITTPRSTKVNLAYTPEIILSGTAVIYAMKSDHMPTVQPKHEKDCG